MHADIRESLFIVNYLKPVRSAVWYTTVDCGFRGGTDRECTVGR
jgi:hypothetical protein